MISRCGSDSQAAENSDAAILDTSYRPSVCRLSDAPDTGDNNRHSGTCLLPAEDEKLINDVLCSDNTLLLKKTCLRYHYQDYAEKIREFQFHVDKVNEIVRPGCSPEILNVALSSMSSSLVNKLSVLSSNQYMHASL